MGELVKCEAGITLCGAEFASPPKGDLREDSRIQIRLRGWLAVGDRMLPCLIENMSTQGFLLMSTTTFAAGTVMGLKCALHSERYLQCTIRIAHVTDCCMGAQIVDISAHNLSLCREVIAEYYLSSASRMLRAESDEPDPD